MEISIEEITAHLNPAQHQAVTAELGPVLVLAGPGSGKTRVLTHRIAYLVRQLHLPPWQIMGVTFTNKAAREMQSRVEKLLGGSPRGILLGTFHSTCARILRRESDQLLSFGYSADFVIFDDDDQLQTIKNSLKELNIDDKKNPPRTLLSAIGSLKDQLISPQQYQPASYAEALVKRIYEQYQKTLVANNAMDFDDLLFNTVRLFDEKPAILQKYQQQYQYLLVDEFQDTNTAQYALLMRFAQTHSNIFAVGDADQSIYKWRGADFRNLERFREQFPKAIQILLEQNYRSTQPILDIAKEVIKNNKGRIHKELFTDRRGGHKAHVQEAFNELEEASWIVDKIALDVSAGRQPGDFAIMYRTNAQSRVLEEMFIRRNLRYKIVGGQRFYGRREIKDLIAYLRLIHNLRDEVSLRRIINTPTRGIGSKTLTDLLEWGATQEVQGGEAVIKVALNPEDSPFSGRAFSSLSRFGFLLHGWHQARKTLSVGDLFGRILQEIDYQAYLKSADDDAEERWANVLEFKGVADAQPELGLAEFLENVALVAEVDEETQKNNVPTLMTLHASKGLEFPVVFITGLEEKILPHSRSLGSPDPDDLGEERRLFYVGITRAEEQLYLTYTFRRSLYGISETATPSRFLSEIPPYLLTGNTKFSQVQSGQSAVKRASQWGTTPPASAEKSPYTSSPRTQTQPPKPASPPPSRSVSFTPSAPLPKPIAPPPPAPKSIAPPVHNYNVGQKVNHAKFGQGVILAVKSTGSDNELTIAFSNAEFGVKRLVASFAKLEII